MKKSLVALTVAMTLAMPVVATAQSDMRTEQVRFAAGTSGTAINDSITGDESVLVHNRRRSRSADENSNGPIEPGHIL